MGGWHAVAAGIDPGRVAELLVTPARPGPGRRGSGYRVSSSAVLTAAHVVRDAAKVQVRFDADRPGEWLTDGTVAWSNQTVDVAVVTITPRPQEEEQVAPVGFGRVAERDAVLTCSAMGFPRFKLRDDPAQPTDDGSPSQYRDSVHAVGSIAVLSNRREGTLEVSVPLPERDPDPDRSPWEGMSGAAVWSSGRILGLVAEHHRTDGLGRLAAVRIDRWYERLTTEQVDRLRTLLPALPAKASALDDVVPPTPSELLEAGYTAQVRDIAPEQLVGREQELAIPGGHPLRHCVPRLLAPSPYAEDVRLAAKQELLAQLHGDQLQVKVIGFITAAGGGLTVGELAELIRRPRGPRPLGQLPWRAGRPRAAGAATGDHRRGGGADRRGGGGVLAVVAAAMSGPPRPQSPGQEDFDNDLQDALTVLATALEQTHRAREQASKSEQTIADAVTAGLLEEGADPAAVDASLSERVDAARRTRKAAEQALEGIDRQVAVARQEESTARQRAATARNDAATAERQLRQVTRRVDALLADERLLDVTGDSDLDLWTSRTALTDALQRRIETADADADEARAAVAAARRTVDAVGADGLLPASRLAEEVARRCQDDHDVPAWPGWRWLADTMTPQAAAAFAAARPEIASGVVVAHPDLVDRAVDAAGHVEIDVALWVGAVVDSKAAAATRDSGTRAHVLLPHQGSL
jgi:hypothetical protein